MSDDTVKELPPLPEVDTHTAGRNILVREVATALHRDMVVVSLQRSGPRDTLTDSQDFAGWAVTQAEALCEELVKRGRL